jgi:hypothetical protein
VTPVFLEELGILNASVDVSSRIIMKMIPKHLLQQSIGFCRNIIRQIGAVLRGKILPSRYSLLHQKRLYRKVVVWAIFSELLIQ